MGLSASERKLVHAIGQTMFPRDRVLDIDAQDAGVVEYVDDYLGRLPPTDRTRVRALIQGFELGFSAWSKRPTARFSSAKPDERAAYLESWATSPTYLRRLALEGLRAMFTFAYVESPVVTEAIGQQVECSPGAAARETA